MNTLTQEKLVRLFSAVFAFRDSDRVMTFLVDVPNEALPDSPAWRERRELARDWRTKLSEAKTELGLERVDLRLYENVGSNNNDLPETFYHWDGDLGTVTADVLRETGRAIPMGALFEESDIVVALTELSATAPCKVLAKKYDFRGTTMPGFQVSMLPSLDIDYNTVHQRIMQIKERLDRAVRETMRFEARGIEYELVCDLRHRTATPSSGIFRDDMVVGNLPSGEAYIVPYEGERDGDPSGTHGKLPVQLGEEIVVYEIRENGAVAVLSDGPRSAKEAEELREEPAYGNIAELGHGILGDFDCEPVGVLLMDEKLGLHVAFGRSEHFGGVTSPKCWKDPKKVVHIDRVYVPSLQPDVVPVSVTLRYEDGSDEVIMRRGAWVI